MYKLILKLCLTVIITLLYISLVYASNQVIYQASPKYYIIRLKSQDPAYPVAFTGSYMASSNLGSKMTRLDKVTPFEIEEKANNLTFMFLVTKHDNDLFKIEVLEKDLTGEHLRLSGTASSEYGMISTDGIAIMGH